ncbi:MAG: protoporphyrinogen oxidase, partial [Bacteroidaceae bacterium]|nr:protoporphyrinogen oxidase [Bacteroidaceae bacterium]
MEKRTTKKEVVIIGAGITGLTTAFRLQQAGWKVTLLEKSNRVGGQIETHKQKGFLFESGPNTGVVSYPEVAELFADIQLPLTTATPLANNRWIWRKKKFYALPSSLISAITTPLFTWKDKFGILAEPFRKPGTNPNETLAELVKRRMGKSYLKYAIDPFISGIYAGDVTKLVTRYALPKLYNLEQEYGSFIGGAIKKKGIPKTKRDLLATKKCFSAPNGLQDLTDALAQQIGKENIQCGANDICIEPNTNNTFTIRYQTEQGAVELTTDKVITTVGAYADR